MLSVSALNIIVHLFFNLQMMIKKYLFSLFVLLQFGLAFSQDFTDSNLPIVIINTDIDPSTNEPYEIPDDPRVLANMKIIKHPDGTRNYLTDQNTAAFLNYNGRISIELRGSSSQDLPKKTLWINHVAGRQYKQQQCEFVGNAK